MNSAIEFYIFEFVLGTKLQLKPTIWFLVPNLPKKCVSDPKQKSEHLHWILHVGISLGTKFQLKLTSLIFWTKFTPKWCFWSNAEKQNSAIDFCIFELVEVLNFSLNRQFWFFGSSLLKKGISGYKRKNCTSSCFTYYIKLFRMGADR